MLNYKEKQKFQYFNTLLRYNIQWKKIIHFYDIFWLITSAGSNTCVKYITYARANNIYTVYLLYRNSSEKG